MRERFTELTGFVLAGGASTRMGRPKHALVLDGETLLERAAHLALSVAARAAVLALPERARHLGLPVLPDELSGRGPLGAIYTGLRNTHTELNLFLSCDLPFMAPRFLRYLVVCALESQAEVTLAESPGVGLEPMAAIYHRRALSVVRRSLANGRNKITGFFPKVTVRVLEWRELESLGFRRRIFDNLNTIEDYEEAVRRAGGPCHLKQHFRSILTSGVVANP